MFSDWAEPRVNSLKWLNFILNLILSLGPSDKDGYPKISHDLHGMGTVDVWSPHLPLVLLGLGFIHDWFGWSQRI
jgi:hypothetical protein